MNSPSEEEKEIINQILEQKFEVVNTKGDDQQIEVLLLQNQAVIIRKNYDTILHQFSYENQTLRTLLKQVKKEDFSQYFPIIYHICEKDKFVYMEKMDEDLFELFGILKEKEEQQQFSEQVVKFFFTQIFEGIQVLHHNSFIHGDLKLANLLIKTSPTYQVKICDFGFSTQTQNGRMSKMPGNSVYYHQKLIRQMKVDPLSEYNGFKFDIFALGVCLFESLAQDGFYQRYLNLYLPDQPIKFWEALHEKYPKTKQWGEYLKELFINMIWPIEEERYTIEQVLNSKWITSLQDEDEEMNLDDRIQQNNQLYKRCTDDRNGMIDTYYALQQAVSYIQEKVLKEEFSSFLKLEQIREAKIIPLQVLNKTSFKSQLTPQELLTIIIAEGDNIATNWKEQGFIDDKDYIFNVEFDNLEINKLTNSSENELQEEEEKNDENDEDNNDLFDIIKNSPLKLTIQIWQIQKNEMNYNSWIQFTNLNKDTYIYYHRHINKIQNIIKQY